MYSGIAIGLTTTLAIGGATALRNGSVAYVCALALMLPTFVQPFVQKRWFKIPSRFSLGVGLALAASSLLTLPMDAWGWMLRAVFAAAGFVLFWCATVLRARKLDNPCLGCPWGSFPLCTHNLPTLQRLADDAAVPADERAFFVALVVPSDASAPGSAPHGCDAG